MIDKAAKAKRTSAIQYLTQLPEVFDLGHFVLLASTTPVSAKVMLSRWAAQGLIAHAGPHSGIYYKRLAQQSSIDDQRACAILTLYPAAMVSGPSVLHAHGWTTQIPRSLHVNVPATSRGVQLFDVALTRRPMKWFARVHEQKALALDHESTLATGGAWDRLRKLTPAWALVDLLAHADGWQPDPDDLDIPEAAHDAVRHAAECLGVDIRSLADFGVDENGASASKERSSNELSY